MFEHYTAEALWADEHRAQKMLAFHLNAAIDVSSRKAEFIAASAQWIIEHFALGPGKSVCDFGCGPGLYTSRFAASGAQVTGIDVSENSLPYARTQAEQAGSPITYTHANYLGVTLPQRFDLITLIMYDFCALSPAQRKTLLKTFAAHLKDGGAILLDVYAMAAFAQREEQSLCEKNQLNHFWCEEDYYCFVNTFAYQDAAVVLDKYSIFPENGPPETVYNWLQNFSPQTLGTELAASGFNVAELLKDVSGAPFSETHSEFAVVARKRS